MTALDTQVQRLVALDYPKRLGVTVAAFEAALRPLRAHAPRAWTEVDIDNGRVDVALVVNTPKLPVRITLPLVERDGHDAIERLYPKKPEDFLPTPAVTIPAGEAYLLLGIDRGNATLNAVPADAARRLALEGRSPLTVEEGVSVLLQWPQFLQPNRCFMMLGSRCGDRRVPALWLSGKQPKLGWCWEGNPHTWLGFASCVSRSPAVRLKVPADPPG
jgi:Family of unknown function (DUF5701)